MGSNHVYKIIRMGIFQYQRQNLFSRDVA